MKPLTWAGVLRLCVLFVPYMFSTEAPALAADPQSCGTIVLPTGIGVSSSADITSMNPLFGTSQYNFQMAELMFMPLVWINSAQQIGWSRSLASAITTPDNGTTYDVILRDWHWSDGVAVTSTDVAYTLQLINAMGAQYSDFGLGGMPAIIKTLNIIDATHFQVVLRRQVNPLWFIYNGLSQLQPLPRHAWGHFTLDQIWQKQSSPAFFNVVDGPLQVQRLDVGLDVILLPNPHYEGPKLHFNRLVFKFLDGDGAALQGVEAGDVDMANLPFSVWNAVQNLQGIYRVNLPVSLGWNSILLNLHNPAVGFLRDVRVRDAIADAIDQKQIVSLVLHGMGAPDLGPVPVSMPHYLSPAMQAGHYPVGYDPAKAAALLQQAGFTMGPGGILQKNGQRLSLTVLFSSGDTEMEQELEIMQAGLRKIGFEMKVRELDFNEVLALSAGPATGWEATAYGNTVNGFPSGENMFSTTGYYNQGGYSDRKMDALIDASVNQPGLAGLSAFEDYASAQQPLIFFISDAIPILARDRIHGVAEAIDQAGDYLPDEWYCTEAGVKK